LIIKSSIKTPPKIHPKAIEQNIPSSSARASSIGVPVKMYILRPCLDRSLSQTGQVFVYR